MPSNTLDSASSLKEEEFNQWLQWMKATPSPLILNLTTCVHDLVLQNRWVSEDHLKFIDTSLEQYISRVGCRVILLPSGSETASFSLVESTGAHVFGKLLYGGVSRYRLLRSGRNNVRRVGESREVMTRNHHHRQRRHYKHPSWVQLGGLQRKYEVRHIELNLTFETFLIHPLIVLFLGYRHGTGRCTRADTAAQTMARSPHRVRQKYNYGWCLW